MERTADFTVPGADAILVWSGNQPKEERVNSLGKNKRTMSDADVSKVLVFLYCYANAS